MSESSARLRWALFAAAVLGVAALPALFLWHTFRPEPWDERILRVRFESVRYEAAALIFTYSVENRAWRSLRLIPDHTEIHPVPSGDGVPSGFPSFAPLLLEGHSTQVVELRLDFPAQPPSSARLAAESLGIFSTPGIMAGAAVPPQPSRGPVATAAPPLSAPPAEGMIEDALRSLDGFDLVNPSKGVRLRFPRGW